MTITSKFPGRCHVCGCAIGIGEQINWLKGVGTSHPTLAHCEVAQKARAAREAEVAKTSPKLNLTPVLLFLKAAITRGLKSPKLRVLALDNKSELKMSLTKGGIAPGSIAVTINGEFVGCIRPDGMLTARLVKDEALQQHLLRVAENPIQYAKQYAALTCNCSFCGKRLEDDGSVEVGYGPVCAKHWGLPHTPKGVRTLQPYPPNATEADKRAIDASRGGLRL